MVGQEEHIYVRCAHERKALRRKTMNDGSKRYCWQCLECGGQAGVWIGRAALGQLRFRDQTLQITDWDDALPRLYSERRQQEYRDQYEAKREAESREWWRRYDLYLNSQKWKRKAAQVMRRANHICEGCLERPATAVHHTTYEHVFDEFLWELRAICDECHRRAHPARFGEDE